MVSEVKITQQLHWPNKDRLLQTMRLGASTLHLPFLYITLSNLSTRKIQGRCSESSQASGVKQHFLTRYSIIFSLERPKNQAKVVTLFWKSGLKFT